MRAELKYLLKLLVLLGVSLVIVSCSGTSNGKATESVHNSITDRKGFAVLQPKLELAKNNDGFSAANLLLPTLSFQKTLHKIVGTPIQLESIDGKLIGNEKALKVKPGNRILKFKYYSSAGGITTSGYYTYRGYFSADHNYDIVLVQPGLIASFTLRDIDTGETHILTKI